MLRWTKLGGGSGGAQKDAASTTNGAGGGPQVVVGADGLTDAERQALEEMDRFYGMENVSRRSMLRIWVWSCRGSREGRKRRTGRRRWLELKSGWKRRRGGGKLALPELFWSMGGCSGVFRSIWGQVRWPGRGGEVRRTSSVNMAKRQRATSFSFLGSFFALAQSISRQTFLFSFELSLSRSR